MLRCFSVLPYAPPLATAESEPAVLAPVLPPAQTSSQESAEPASTALPVLSFAPTPEHLEGAALEQWRADNKALLDKVAWYHGVTVSVFITCCLWLGVQR